MKEELKNFLKQLGLALSEEKTKGTHITEGFNFLGYKVIQGVSAHGKTVRKVQVPEKAIKRFQHRIREMFAPSTHHESMNAKILAANRLIQGWCEYYRCTNSPNAVCSKFRPEVYWGMAHWLGRKYQLNMPAVMQRYGKGDTFQTKMRTLKMPSEYKPKRFVARTWHNPYTEPDAVQSERDRIKRESLFSYNQVWGGNEDRSGGMDRREELLLLKGPTCAECGKTFHPSELQMDHIIVRARFKDPKKADRLENQQLLCTNCHRAKTKLDWKVLSRMR